MTEGDLLADLAAQTCDELDGAILLQVGGILLRGTEDASEIGFSAQELGDAMRSVCPLIVAQMQDWSSQQGARESLPTQIALGLDGCFSDGATGSVTNNSGVTVSVYVDVQFLDSDGVLLASGLGSVRGLRPGQTGLWDAYYSGSTYARCEVDISNVFED